MGGWMAPFCLSVYGWTDRQHAPTPSAYLMLLSTGVTDLLTELLQELLHLLTGFLQCNLLLPQLSLLGSQYMYGILQLGQFSSDLAVKVTEPPSKDGESHPPSIRHPYYHQP